MPSSSAYSRVTPARPVGAKATYNQVSRWYDWVAGPFERRLVRAGVDMLDVRGGERVLEVGFGTGNALVMLARRVGDAGRVNGVDISDGMSAVARVKVRRNGLSNRVELTCDDIQSVTLDRERFDAVFMAFTLELFDPTEMDIVLRRCRQALKAGGRICVVALSATEKPGVVERLYTWAHALFPHFIDCRPIAVRRTLARAGFDAGHEKTYSLCCLPVSVCLAKKRPVQASAGSGGIAT